MMQGSIMATTSTQLSLASSSFVGQVAAVPTGRVRWSTSAIAPCASSNSNMRKTICSLAADNLRVVQTVRMAILMPLAAAAVLATSPLRADAGILSGSSGLESFQLPSVPEPGFLKQLTEDKKKMYEGFDANFKASPYLEQLLKKSKDNAAMHKKEIADKYCERGAEWGVGDCSLVGMSEAEKEAFMKVLKQK